MQIDVRFPCSDGHAMRGVLTMPDAAAHKLPALLLIYEIMGMNEEMKRVARDLAEQGYVVLIPDIFDRGPPAICVARAIRASLAGAGRPVDDLENARAWLAARPEVDPERMGAIGFCMGGGFCLVLALTGRYRAVAPLYAHIPRTLPAAERACPVVASYGAKDRTLIEDPEILRAQLERLEVPHDIKVYPEAGHAFYTRGPAGILGTILLRSPMAGGYHEPSALDARERILAFFAEHLAAPGSSSAQVA